jgi:hypothetical protein
MMRNGERRLIRRRSSYLSRDQGQEIKVLTLALLAFEPEGDAVEPRQRGKRHTSTHAGWEERKNKYIKKQRLKKTSTAVKWYERKNKRKHSSSCDTFFICLSEAWRSTRTLVTPLRKDFSSNVSETSSSIVVEKNRQNHPIGYYTYGVADARGSPEALDRLLMVTGDQNTRDMVTKIDGKATDQSKLWMCIK